MYQKMLPDQFKSSVFLLTAVTERAWAGHGWRPRVMAGSWSLENQYVFLSSLRELCLSLAITVCHATEGRGHTLPSHASFHPDSGGIAFLNILSTSKEKHVILLFSHGAKKAPLPSGDLYSSSTDRSSEPSPSFICLSIRLPVFTPYHLSPVLLTEDLSIALVGNQYVLWLFLLRIYILLWVLVWNGLKSRTCCSRHALINAVSGIPPTDANLFVMYAACLDFAFPSSSLPNVP